MNTSLGTHNPYNFGDPTGIPHAIINEAEKFINKPLKKRAHELESQRNKQNKKAQKAPAPEQNTNLQQKQFERTPRKPAQTKSLTTTLADGTKVTTRVPVANAEKLTSLHTTSEAGQHQLKNAVRPAAVAKASVAKAPAAKAAAARAGRAANPAAKAGSSLKTTNTSLKTK